VRKKRRQQTIREAISKCDKQWWEEIVNDPELKKLKKKGGEKTPKDPGIEKNTLIE